MGKLKRVSPILLATTNPIRAGRRIRGPRQQQDMAYANNWLHGTGSSLVVSGPRYKVLAPGDAYSPSFYAWPHEQNPNRVWVLSISVVSGTGAFGSIEVNGVELDPWVVIPVGANTQSFRILENVASPSDTPGPIDVVITNDPSSASSVIIQGVCCYELPRYDIEIYGGSTIPAENSLARGQAIYEGSANQSSIDGVIRSAANAPLQARRCALFNWAHDDGVTLDETSDTGGTETDPLGSGGYSNLFSDDIPVQTRCLWNPVTTAREIEYAIKLKVSAGTGHVRLRSSILDVVDFTVTSTSPTWKTGTILTKVEDPSRHLIDGGLRGGTLPEIRATFWNAGGTITPYSVNFGESAATSAGP